MAYCVGEQARQAARSVDKRLRPLCDTFVSISESGSGTGGCRVRSHSYSGYKTYQHSKINIKCIPVDMSDCDSELSDDSLHIREEQQEEEHHEEQWPSTDDEAEEEAVQLPKVQLPKLLGSRADEKKPLRLEAIQRRSWCDVEEDLEDITNLMPCGSDFIFDASPETDTTVGSSPQPQQQHQQQHQQQQYVASTSYAVSGWTSSTHSAHYNGVRMSAESTPTVQFHGHSTSCSPMSSNAFAMPAVQTLAERPKAVTIALACALTPEATPSGSMSVMPSGFHMGQTMAPAPPFPCGAYEQRHMGSPPHRQADVDMRNGCSMMYRMDVPAMPFSAPAMRSSYDAAAIDAQSLPPLPKADSSVTLSTAATPTSAFTPAGDRQVPQGCYLGTVPSQTPKTPPRTQDSEPLRMSETAMTAVADTASPPKLSDAVSPVREDAVADAGSSSRTTVMLRNLPIFLTQRRLLEELDMTGFRGLYDFCYMPCCFNSGHGKGFAFVNFALPEHATSFMNSWGAQRKFGVTQPLPALNISYADIQGKDANAAKWDNQRLRRVRNPKLRPFIADLSGVRSQ
eukprot:TRINITY_DN25111_c0_g2_i1.p1 TRINITY_DN25111_c0_g2~~TRINITY_DN25111_c0_g2_i1.p1  ORF type:complete len:614 (-),score=105.33 TRINITY_DN25111_c0_g2_i1:62-1765(-)